MPSTWRRSALIEVAVDDHAHLLGAEGEAMDAIPGGSFHKFCCCQSCGDFENDNVGLDGIYGGDPAQSCEHVSDLLGPAVVFVQSGQFVIQGVVAGRCQNTDLAHPSAENFARTVRFGDEGLRANQHRTNRRAEAFGEAH